jgi:hypothetical protein
MILDACKCLILLGQDRIMLYDVCVVDAIPARQFRFAVNYLGAFKMQQTQMSKAVQATGKGAKRTFVKLLPQHGASVDGGKKTHLVIPVKGADGAWTTADIDVSNEALNIIDRGMGSAYATEQIWKKGAVTLVREFFNGYEPKKTMTANAIVDKLVAMKDSMQKFFGALVVRHPSYTADVLRLRAMVASGKYPEGMTEKDAQGSIENNLRTIRATANNQRNKVLEYFAKEHASDTAKDENTRNSMGWFDIADGWRKEGTKRIDGARGKFEDKAEREALAHVVDAIVLAIAEVKASRKLPTSTHDVNAPALSKAKRAVGSAAKKAAKKGGEVTRLLKGEVPNLETEDAE